MAEDVIEATGEARYQTMRDGNISEEIPDTVSRDLMPMEVYFKVANQSFQRRLEANEKK